MQRRCNHTYAEKVGLIGLGMLRRLISIRSIVSVYLSVHMLRRLDYEFGLGIVNINQQYSFSIVCKYSFLALIVSV
jgi:hypothetical protein